MKCIKCNGDTRVADSRVSDDRKSVKRRRECLVCLVRFNTLEIVEAEYVSLVGVATASGKDDGNGDTP